jgi:nucleotide sugar dehydrogenase
MRDLPTTSAIGIVGLGYVGLPTALALLPKGVRVIGYDISERRIDAIRSGDVDLIPTDRTRLAEFGTSSLLTLTTDPESLCEADTILICVPTPVDKHHNPDLRAITGACQTVVANARPGQTLVLTSTTYVGCTNELLVEPLAARGMTVGGDIFVAFSPERIDPGNTRDVQETVPRVIGGYTRECAERTAAAIELVAPSVRIVSSTQAAELTKIHENTFRAINIAYVNELAKIATALGIDITEVVSAAATKPFGFMPFMPGPGVGGHCIPCDPHYLLAALPALGTSAPIIEAAMHGIAERPAYVVGRVRDELDAVGKTVNDSRICVVGVAFKPNVSDIRETPATEVIDGLVRRGAIVTYYDPLVEEFTVGERSIRRSVPDPDLYDAIVILTAHDGQDYTWFYSHELVIDASYKLDAIKGRILP